MRIKMKEVLCGTFIITVTTLVGCTGTVANEALMQGQLEVAHTEQEYDYIKVFEENSEKDLEVISNNTEEKLDDSFELPNLISEDEKTEEVDKVDETETENLNANNTNDKVDKEEASDSYMFEDNNISENDETRIIEDNNLNTQLPDINNSNANIDTGINTNENTNTDGLNTDNVNIDIMTPQYMCQARVLNSNEIYSNSRVAVYIKTDHPDGTKLSLSTNSGAFTNDIGVTYSDINYVESDNIRSYMERVEGGYVCVIEPQNVGYYTFVINDSSSGKSVPIGSFDMVVKDRIAAENEFYLSVISSVTTSDMTNVQKMDAICMYVSNNFMYKASDVNGNKIYLTSLEGPWVANHRVNCLETTAMMMEFAKRLGLQSESTYAGYSNHYYATVTIDGVPYVYDACPMGETGTVSSWNYVL